MSYNNSIPLPIFFHEGIHFSLDTNVFMVYNRLKGLRV